MTFKNFYQALINTGSVLKPNKSGLATAGSAVVSILLVLILAYTSDRCKSRFGRRRPFIFGLGMMIGLCAALLHLSSISSIELIIRQCSIFIVMVAIDAIMICVETPLLAFTMESFNQRDRERIITGVSMFGGLGNISGIAILAFMPKHNALMLCLIFVFITFMMNIVSRKEIPLGKLKYKPKLESMMKTLKSYITMPKCMRWLGIYDFFLWSSLTGMWVWFTHIYAETVGNADSNLRIENATLYETVYDEATKEAAMVMITFPLSAMVLGFVFTKFNLFNRVSKKIIFQSFNIMLAGSYGIVYVAPTKELFYFMGLLLGFSSILINSALFLLIDTYRAREDYPTNRGLGNDNSVCTISGK